MKRWIWLVALLVACKSASSPPPPTTSSAAPAPAPAPTIPDEPGRVVDGEIESAAIGARKRYKIWLPAGYDTLTSRRYPVVYMLHGFGGDERDWVESAALDAAADALKLQAIVVMPDGDRSFYANSATEPAARYEDYITSDLVGHVDATYRTIATRDARGIGGLSMGGFGALQLAMRHPDVFAAAASHSGVDALLYLGPHPYVAGQAQELQDVRQWGLSIGPIGAAVRDVFGSDPDNWKAHDPAHLARSLKDGDLAIYLDCGTEDFFLLHDGAQYLHDILVARGVTHDWYLGPGTHTYDFWRERIDDSLAFFARSLTPAR
jgi:S-formylglutathione hydrolase FrmB